MTSDYWPVDPSHLVRYGVDPARASGTAPSPFEPGGMTVNSTQMSASAATELGYGKLVNMKASGEAFYYNVDFAATQVVTVPDATTQGGFSSFVWGAGLRLAVKSWAVKGEVSASVYGVAASAELSLSSTAFALTTFGTGVAGLGEVTTLVQGALGKFDVNTVSKLGAAITVIGKHVETNVRTLKPELIGTIREKMPDEESRIASVLYATESVARRWTLEKAELVLLGNDAPDKGFEISVPIVRHAYEDLFVLTDPQAEPSDENVDKAEKLLNG